MKFKDYLLEMAKPNNILKSKKYYHGVYNYEIAEYVIENGISPPKKSKQAKGLSPVKGSVYFAQKIYDSLLYAKGLNDKQKRYRYGFIFEIDGDDLMDIFPDEDDVLVLLGKCMKKYDSNYKIHMDIREEVPEDILEIVKKYYDKLSEEDKKNVKLGYEINIKSGLPIAKKVIKEFTDEDILLIVESGYKLFNKGSVNPSSVYIIDKWQTNKGMKHFDEFSKKVSLEKLNNYFKKGLLKDNKDYFSELD